MAQIINKMTLTQHKLYNVIQHSNAQASCVIVSPNSSNNNNNKIQMHSKRILAPATERNSVVYNNDSDGRCKRKVQFMTYNSSVQQPASVARRNARERNRVKQVNNGFAALRQHIPSNVMAAFGTSENTTAGRGGSKKLSKVETLKVAVEYIKSLQGMLEEHESEIASNNIINSIVDNRYYPESPEPQQFANYPLTMIPTPPSSETASSPTPSQTSELSCPLYQPTTIYLQNLETKNPNDEELLDAIFSWQQTE